MIWLLTIVALISLVTAGTLLYVCRILGQMAECFSLLGDTLVAMAADKKASKPVAWYVTFVAFIDHDARNAGVPHQERLYSGMQWVVGSRTLQAEINGKVAMSPQLLKDLAYQMLANDDVNHLELLNIVPLTAADVEADDFYKSAKADLAQQTGDVK